MPDSFSQIYIQIVFAVKHRKASIDSAWENQLYQYITGIVRNKGQKLIAINGISDHIHLFIGMKPDCCLSDLIREIKKSSNEFINKNHFTKDKFNWQEGYGAFSYSHSQIETVAKYVMNQKEHHKRMTFQDEYVQFLNKFNIEFDKKYLFAWIDEELQR